MKYIASVNFYCKGIQAGIQAGHALDQLWSEMVELGTRRSKSAEARFKMLREFSRDHKTWIILNGGDHETLGDLYKFMTKQTTYPFTMFQEPGLNYANTAVGIILPEHMYDDISTAVGKAMLKAEETGTTDWTKFIDDNVDLVGRKLLSVVHNRHYNSWEREFLKRKVMCKLAS